MGALPVTKGNLRLLPKPVFHVVGGVLEDPLPLRLGLHFHREITLPMGDPGRVANVVI
jgi:hypothetical protein